MSSPGGIPSISVAARVGRIESLLAARQPAASAVLDAPAPRSLKDFDPFGTAYQQALFTVETRPPEATGLPTVSGAPAGAIVDLTVATRRPYSADRIAAYAGRGTRAGGGSSVGQVGGYGSMPIPDDLAGYGNGNIPAGALELIGQGGHRLWQPAADSWRAMVSAAAADGIDLTITDSYRSYDNQVDLAERKGLYANGGYAATPGMSNHGWGLAVDADVSDPATLDWLRANGHAFGFVEAVKREPWHWEYRPDQA